MHSYIGVSKHVLRERNAVTTPLLWTVAQAAEELQVSSKHMYRLVKENRIPYIRVGASLRFSPDELRRWLTAKQVPAVK